MVPRFQIDHGHARHGSFGAHHALGFGTAFQALGWDANVPVPSAFLLYADVRAGPGAMPSLSATTTRELDMSLTQDIRIDAVAFERDRLRSSPGG
jgi:hypothetical protein